MSRVTQHRGAKRDAIGDRPAYFESSAMEAKRWQASPIFRLAASDSKCEIAGAMRTVYEAELIFCLAVESKLQMDCGGWPQGG